MRFYFILLLFIFSSCNDEANSPGTSSKPLPVRAADISFLPQIEQFPASYLDSNGTQIDVVELLNSHGCNTIRIRLWHTPASTHSGLEEVEEFAARIRSVGLKIWLDIHYSDTWADPGNQTKPSAWNALGFSTLSDSVYAYTKKVVTLISPDIIQIGNEINSGFLWPDGNISNVTNFTTLLKRGVQAVRDFSPQTKVMIHIAGHENAQWYYQQLQSKNVDYDMIGLSYYPLWHGKDLDALKSNLDGLGFMFGKEIVIAETAYPFTLGWNDWTNNIVGESWQLIDGYPATEDGQKQFLLKLKQIISGAEKGAGFCYWAPEWIAYKGDQSTTGSSWENMALFDFSKKALPALVVFE